MPGDETTEASRLALTNLAPGGKATVAELARGVHKFQCCFHPWMRAAIKVQ